MISDDNARLAAWVGYNGVTELPDFMNDIGACFKWLVPRLWVCELKTEEAIFWVARVGAPHIGDGKIHTAVSENPAAALSEAILEAIG